MQTRANKTAVNAITYGRCPLDQNTAMFWVSSTVCRTVTQPQLNLNKIEPKRAEDKCRSIVANFARKSFEWLLLYTSVCFNAKSIELYFRNCKMRTSQLTS